MARLIAFDQKTAATLRRQMPQHQTFEHGASDVVDFAIGGPETLVAVLPVDAPNQAGVAVFRRPKAERLPLPAQEEETTAKIQPPPQPPTADTSSVREVPSESLSQPLSSLSRAEEPLQSTPSRIRAGGFLGLRDEAVFDDEQPKLPSKRSWWSKFWDDEE
jgi:hypothetical protein